MKPPSFLHEFLKPEALKQYVEIMDIMASEHLDMYWASNMLGNYTIPYIPDL